jgi:hypothetical protein
MRQSFMDSRGVRSFSSFHKKRRRFSSEEAPPFGETHKDFRHVVSPGLIQLRASTACELKIENDSAADARSLLPEGAEVRGKEVALYAHREARLNLVIHSATGHDPKSIVRSSPN